MAQEKQQKSATSSDRKDRILDHLFFRRTETETKPNIFRGLLDTFSDFVKTFQSEKPLIHTLHNSMVELVQQFLGMFIKPEHIPERVSKLVKLDFSDRTIQKVDKDLGVGKFAFVGLNKARLDKTCHHWVNAVYAHLRTGYVQASKKLMQMPLTNNTLRLLSVLDPDFIGHQQTTTSFQRLAGKTLFAEDPIMMGKLAEEAARYNVDEDAKHLAANYNDKEPVDEGFWGKVFNLESFNQPRYPALKRLASSLLTIFSGPLVESSFNIMDDIVEKDRASLTVENYEAIAIIKTTLRKKKEKSTTMKVDARMKCACINAYSRYRAFLEKKKLLKQKNMQEKLNASLQLLKTEKAKRVAKLHRLAKQMVLKRKQTNESGTNGQNKWKRIKLG